MSNGVFSKFELIDDMLKKLDVLADAKGTFRCGLIWDISNEMKALREGLEKEDAANKQLIKSMEANVEGGKVCVQ